MEQRPAEPKALQCEAMRNEDGGSHKTELAMTKVQTVVTQDICLWSVEGKLKVLSPWCLPWLRS